MSLRANKFLFVAILFSSLAFDSCKKDDAPHPLQSGVYTSDKAGDFGSVRLFTNSGEVRDQNIINTYKVKFATQLTPVNNAGTTTDSLLVIDENNVKIGGRDFAVFKVDNYYQFRSKDTLSYLGGLDPVYLNMVKYKPYYLATLVPTSNGLSQHTTTLQDFYASTTSNGLVFPMFNIVRFTTVHYTSTLSYQNYAAFNVNNLFDDKFPVNTLNADSVLVQSYNVYFKK